jgi:hypothetical protein
MILTIFCATFWLSSTAHCSVQNHHQLAFLNQAIVPSKGFTKGMYDVLVKKYGENSISRDSSLFHAMHSAVTTHFSELPWYKIPKPIQIAQHGNDAGQSIIIGFPDRYSICSSKARPTRARGDGPFANVVFSLPLRRVKGFYAWVSIGYRASICVETDDDERLDTSVSKHIDKVAIFGLGYQCAEDGEESDERYPFLDQYAKAIDEVAEKTTLLLQAEQYQNGEQWLKDAELYEELVLVPLFTQLSKFKWVSDDDPSQLAREYILPDAEALICDQHGNYKVVRLSTSRTLPLNNSEVLTIPSLAQLYAQVNALKKAGLN